MARFHIEREPSAPLPLQATSHERAPRYKKSQAGQLCEKSMPRSDSDDGSGYDSVDEDAELELSCALHDLAERVKTFEENMKGRLRVNGMEIEDDDEEIGEEIPEVDEDHGLSQSYGYASPKKKNIKLGSSLAKRVHHRRGAKQSKQQEDEDEDDKEDDKDDDDADKELEECEAKKAPTHRSSDWNENDEREELCEIKYNISKLLQGFKEQARALDEAGVGNQ